MNRSQDSDQPTRKQLPPPVAFNIEAPKPGVAVRKGGATKKACVGDHTKKKQPCSGRHETQEEENSVFEEAEESVLSPNSEKRKRSESSSLKSERITSDELDMSQVGDNVLLFEECFVREF